MPPGWTLKPLRADVLLRVEYDSVLRQVRIRARPIASFLLYCFYLGVCLGLPSIAAQVWWSQHQGSRPAHVPDVARIVMPVLFTGIPLMCLAGIAWQFVPFLQQEPVLTYDVQQRMLRIRGEHIDPTGWIMAVARRQTKASAQSRVTTISSYLTLERAATNGTEVIDLFVGNSFRRLESIAAQLAPSIGLPLVIRRTSMLADILGG